VEAGLLLGQPNNCICSAVALPAQKQPSVGNVHPHSQHSLARQHRPLHARSRASVFMSASRSRNAALSHLSLLSNLKEIKIKNIIIFYFFIKKIKQNNLHCFQYNK